MRRIKALLPLTDEGGRNGVLWLQKVHRDEIRRLSFAQEGYPQTAAAWDGQKSTHIEPTSENAPRLERFANPS